MFDRRDKQSNIYLWNLYHEYLFSAFTVVEVRTRFDVHALSIFSCGVVLEGKKLLRVVVAKVLPSGRNHRKQEPRSFSTEETIAKGFLLF